MSVCFSKYCVNKAILESENNSDIECIILCETVYVEGKLV